MSVPINKDYMDIDEFLCSRELCGGLTLPEDEVSGDDFSNMADPVDFALSDDQLHEYTAHEIDIESQLECAPSPISSDEGQGRSICSENSNESSSGCEKSTDIGEKIQCKKRGKRITSGAGDSSIAKARTSTSTWKVSKSGSKLHKQCLATSVEIEGVSYTYSLMPTSKGRKQNRRSVPGSMKDDKYWDRRFKNNEAAKRSRDLRRRKEMLVASKASDLESENEELKAEVAFLRERVKILNNKLSEKTM